MHGTRDLSWLNCVFFLDNSIVEDVFAFDYSLRVERKCDSVGWNGGRQKRYRSGTRTTIERFQFNVNVTAFNGNQREEIRWFSLEQKKNSNCKKNRQQCSLSTSLWGQSMSMFNDKPLSGKCAAAEGRRVRIQAPGPHRSSKRVLLLLCIVPSRLFRLLQAGNASTRRVKWTANVSLLTRPANKEIIGQMSKLVQKVNKNGPTFSQGIRWLISAKSFALQKMTRQAWANHAARPTW